MDPEDLLRRHRPAADPAGLARARRRLDAAVAADPSPADPSPSPARRTRWRIAVPLAAAVALGGVLVLWPDPATPSAFADWSATPERIGDAALMSSATLECQDMVATEAAQVAARVREDLHSAVVDSRGSWRLVVLTADDSPLQVQCLLDAGGNGTARVTTESSPLAAGAGLVSVENATMPGWRQLTGQVEAAVQRVEVTLEDATRIEASLSDATVSTDMAGGAGSAGLALRTFVTWWPADASGPVATSVTTYDAAGTVVEYGLTP